MSDVRVSQISFNTVANLVIVSAISFNPAASTTDVRVSHFAFNPAAVVAPVAQASFGGGSSDFTFSQLRYDDISMDRLALRKRQIAEDEEIIMVLFQAITNGRQS